jgi:hypothetical protein
MGHRVEECGVRVVRGEGRRWLFVGNGDLKGKRAGIRPSPRGDGMEKAGDV